jgi:hypothetical protein
VDLNDGNTNITLDTRLNFTAQMNQGAEWDGEFFGGIYFIISLPYPLFWLLK